MTRILIIEDNDEINGLLKSILTEAGYEVKQAYSGPEGLLYFKSDAYNMILLDLMLPGMCGEEILAEIRKTSDVPVIVLSAKAGIDDKVALLENGADDYITKPFEVREVLARVELRLKKNVKSDKLSSDITFKELRISQDERRLYADGNPVELTNHEYNIILELMKHPEKIYSKQELFELAWDEYYVGEDKTLNVHISNIRKKLRPYVSEEYITTVWGIGFRLT